MDSVELCQCSCSLYTLMPLLYIYHSASPSHLFICIATLSPSFYLKQDLFSPLSSASISTSLCPFSLHLPGCHPPPHPISHSVSSEIKVARHGVFNPLLLLLISTFSSPAVKLRGRYSYRHIQRCTCMTQRSEAIHMKHKSIPYSSI